MTSFNLLTKIEHMDQLKEKIIPFFMYGTAWKEDKTEELTLLSLQSGFRAIDTANQRKHYFEEGVGNGIERFLRSGEFRREDLFIQTKFTYKEGQDQRLPYDPKADYPIQVKQSFQSSLEHLKTDYVDSYILHGPSTGHGLNKKDFEVWNAMESLYDDGLARNIGVSNINANQLELLIKKESVKPAFVQNRCYARLGWDKIVRDICDENNIIYQGFSLLTANRDVILNSKVSQIAETHGATNPDIIFSFARQIGMLPLTGTTNQDHMRQDLAGSNIPLSEDEVQLIVTIAVN